MSLAEYIEDEGIIYDEIINHMLAGYADGAQVAVIYTSNWLAYGSLTKWCAGWIRKAGIGGTWKDSKGHAIQHQPKIEIILALKRRIKLELHLIEENVIQFPLYMIQFNALEIFQE